MDLNDSWLAFPRVLKLGLICREIAEHVSTLSSM
jgi:hypothetical protein